MKRSSRGSVGRSFRQTERFQKDKEFREKRLEMQRGYYKNNREKIQQRHKKWEKELNKFANKRCKNKDCNKLLSYKNISGFCRKHIWTWRKKK